MNAQKIHQAVLQSPPADVNDVHDLLERVWAGSPEVDVMERCRFETALVELSGNVFEHADAGHGLVCTLEVTVSADRMVALVVDSGIPLDCDFTQGGMPDDLAESGRGMALIQALVDELSYVREHDTNRWRVVLALQSPSAQPSRSTQEERP